MRSIALAFVLVLALGCVQAYPLVGGNGAVNCTLFGVTKVPVPGQDPNATVQNYNLKVDVGLIGTRNATFSLVDSKDQVYSPDTSLTRPLQPGRQLLVFVVPKDALFKLFKVSPSEGNPFEIKWWKTPKKIQGDLVLRYYGVVNSRINSDEQSVTYEVGIQNNGSNSIYISPENFTLLDQWAWEYYTIDGFSPTYLGAKKSTKVKVNFSSISPLSKPSALAYDYSTSNQIVVDLEKDAGPLTDAQVYGTNAPSPAATPGASVKTTPQTASAVQTASQAAIPNNPVSSNTTNTKSSISSGIMSLKDQINATKARLANMGSPGTPGGNSSVGGQISSSVNEAIARLERMKEGLPNGQQPGQSAGTLPSVVG